MKDGDATAYSYWLFQYMRRMDGFPPASFLLMPLDRVFDPEDARAWQDSNTTLREIEGECFQYPKVWICQRAAKSVFPVGVHSKYEHTSLWVSIVDEEKPDGQEACIIDFTKDLRLIVKEVSALWKRQQSFLSSLKNEGGNWGETDYNAIERFMASGLRSLSDAPTSRAIGLWLWDRVQELGNVRGSIMLAIKEMASKFDLRSLNVDSLEDSDFRFLLRRTNKCIDAGEVLSFTKK